MPVERPTMLQSMTQPRGRRAHASPARRATEYPHTFSGGMQQRAMIARGIALEPRLLIADEPTTALDVTVQAQVLHLFKQTRTDLGLTCIFVGHNLDVIRYVSDHVAVMRQGVVEEQGPGRGGRSAPGGYFSGNPALRRSSSHACFQGWLTGRSDSAATVSLGWVTSHFAIAARASSMRPSRT